VFQYVQPPYVKVTPDGGFKLADTKLSVTKNDALWMLFVVTNGLPSSLQSYVDLIVDAMRTSDKFYIKPMVLRLNKDRDVVTKIIDDDMFEDANLTIQNNKLCRPDLIGNEQSYAIKPPEKRFCKQDEIVDEVYKLDKVTPNEVYKLISYENVCTKERIIAKFSDRDLIYPEFKVLLFLSTDISEKDADACVQMIQQLHTISSTCDVIPKNDLWKALASLDADV
jgi:hypothetical protein